MLKKLFQLWLLLMTLTLTLPVCAAKEKEQLKLEELTEKIRTTLEKIGFTEIGDRIALTPPALSLSLDDLILPASSDNSVSRLENSASSLAGAALAGTASRNTRSLFT